MKHLESEVTSTPPPSINTTIIDALFFLHLLTSSFLPPRFGAVARSLLQKVMYAEGDAIHFVTDKWLSPSIKDCERDLRMSSSTAFSITGPCQKRPSNWNQALKNNNFKKSLFEFLLNTWKDDSCASIFKQKTLFANSGDVCYRYNVVDGRVQRKVDDGLHNDHEKADCLMFYHLAKTTAPSNVVIRTSDTDCLIIALGCYQFLDQSLKIWI